MKKLYWLLIIAVFCLAGIVGLGQEKSKDKVKNKTHKEEFCSKQTGWSNGKRVSANDLREKTIAAGSLVKVDSKNGRITVKGENRKDVLVRACVRAWGTSDSKASSIVKSIRVATSPVIRAENTEEKKHWSVSYEILVPRSTNLDLLAGNGRITISSVQGQIKFKTHNGRITLSDVAGDVKGKTRNGRVTVRLSGNAWQGSGLDVETLNGRVGLYLPSNYAANVEAGTANGRFSSSFAELQVEKKGRKHRHGPQRVSASINGGGAKIRVVTTNGRVRIGTTKQVFQ